MLALLISQAFSVTKKLCITYEEYTNKLILTEDEWKDYAVVNAYFSDDDPSNSGYPSLYIKSTDRRDDIIHYRAIGAAEGYFTEHLAKKAFQARKTYMCKHYIQCEDGNYPQVLVEYFKNNYEFMKNYTSGTLTAIKSHIRNLIYYFDGLLDVLEDPFTTKEELWMYMCPHELYNIARYYNLTQGDHLTDRTNTIFIAPKADNSDVFIGMNEVSGYGEATNRIQKTIIFPDGITQTSASRPFEIFPDFVISSKGFIALSSNLASLSVPRNDDYKGIPHWIRGSIGISKGFGGFDALNQFNNYPMSGDSSTFFVVDMTKIAPYRRIKSQFVSISEMNYGIYEKADLSLSFQGVKTVGLPILETDFKNKTMGGCSASPECVKLEKRAKLFESLGNEVDSEKRMREMIYYNDPTNSLQENDMALGVAPREEAELCRGTIFGQVTTVGTALQKVSMARYGAPNKNVSPFKFTEATSCDSEDKGDLKDSIDGEWKNLIVPQEIF